MAIDSKDYSRYRVRKFFMYVIVAGVVPLVLFLPLMFYAPQSFIVWIVGILLFVAGSVVATTVFDPQLTKKEKAAKRDLQQRIQQGEVLASETEQPFNEEDIRKIQERKTFVYIGMPIAGTLLAAMIVVFMQFTMDTAYKLPIQAITVTIIFIGLYFISVRDIRRINGWIENGRKTIIRGVITDKYVGRNRDFYSITIGNEEVIVSDKLYRKYDVGDAAEFHVFKEARNLVLYEGKVG